MTLGGRTVIDGLSLAVETGRTTVLLGRSGSGKTTLLRLVNRLLEPGRGQVHIDGRASGAWDVIELRRRTGYIIQDAGLMPHYTVARNVGLVCELENWPRPRIEARVRELLDFVSLPYDAYGQRMPHQLSGGERQRVGVARALGVDPPVLLCDEPFGALDPITRSELAREFRALAKRLGKTILFVTHDVREALALADRIVLLHRGRIAVDATASEFRNSSEPTARDFLASIEP